MLNVPPRCAQFLQQLHVVQAVHIPVGEHVPACDLGIVTHVPRKTLPRIPRAPVRQPMDDDFAALCAPLAITVTAYRARARDRLDCLQCFTSKSAKISVATLNKLEVGRPPIAEMSWRDPRSWLSTIRSSRSSPFGPSLIPLLPVLLPGEPDYPSASSPGRSANSVSTTTDVLRPLNKNDTDMWPLKVEREQ
jgi:hypothetical protein